MNYFKWIVLFFGFIANAQTPVWSLEQDNLLFIEEGKVLSQEKSILFSTKGNIVFKGNSSSFKDILFTLALDSVSQKKEGIIYDKKGSASQFSLQESMVYFEYKGESYGVVTLLKNEGSWAIYNNLNDSLLAYIPNLQLSSATLFATFYALWNSNGMKDQLIESLKVSNAASMDGLAVMQPVFGAGIVWVWDGTYLYPNGVNMSHSMVWKFEDNKLNPVHYPRNQEEWAWDGQGLKPYWGGNPQSQWTWQNGVLRQIWNNNHQNEYFIDDNIIRKRFGSYGDNEWEIKGDMPLPLITAVVLGLLFR